MLRTRLALFVLPLALIACGGGGGDDPGGGDPPGNTTVSFQQDLLPLFQSVCKHCHGGAGGLELDTYQQLMNGGDSGPVVIAGDPDGSLLVKRLEGTIKPQMPADRAALSDNEILTVRLWIQEGAQNN